MLYLDVPYAEKDEAKRLGARWDPNMKYGMWKSDLIIQNLQRGGGCYLCSCLPGCRTKLPYDKKMDFEFD